MPPSDHPPDKKNYRVRLVQGWKVVLAMVLPPLLILPCIYLLAQIHGLSEPILFGVIAVMVLSLCGAAIWLVFRCISLVDYSIGEDLHGVEVVRPTLLSVRSFDFRIAEVTGFQICQSKGRLYFTVMTPGYPGKFSINAASDREEDVAQFEELMAFVAARVNARKEAMRAAVEGQGPAR